VALSGACPWCVLRKAGRAGMLVLVSPAGLIMLALHKLVTAKLNYIAQVAKFRLIAVVKTAAVHEERTYLILNRFCCAVLI